MFWRERVRRKRRPRPKLAPQSFSAACSFGLGLPPPKKPPPAGGPPVPEPPDGGREPAGREGRVTPWLFRHATSAARLELEEPPAEATAVELALPELEDALEALELLEELLPHAATAQPVASTTRATGARRVAMSMSLKM